MLWRFPQHMWLFWLARCVFYFAGTFFNHKILWYAFLLELAYATFDHPQNLQNQTNKCSTCRDRARLFRSAVNITSASQPTSLQKVTATNCGWPTILRIQHPNYNQRPLSIYSKCMQIAWCIVKKTSISIYHMLQKSVKEFAILSWELFCCLKW